MTHLLAAGGTNLDPLYDEGLFWVLAVLSVGAGIAMICVRQAVHCALMLAVVMLSLAVMYAMQGAPFLAFVQIIVYTGAVLMLFLFVLMIVGITSSDSVTETIKGQRLYAGLAGIGFLVLLSLVIGNAAVGPAAPPAAGFGSGNVAGIAKLLFTTYVFPFEVTSALLITAALGAMVLAHRERTAPKPTQRSLARARIASGRPTPLPGPGSFAQHNAVDLPALLPDGSPSPLSVSEVISQTVPAQTVPAQTVPAQTVPAQMEPAQTVPATGAPDRAALPASQDQEEA
jgi:NADH-quinone oxidoreductase subunit J